MSYILEALRRSQAERERGQVPGLNAQASAVAALPTQREGAPWPTLLLAVVGALAVAALALWFWRAPLAQTVPAAPAGAVLGAAPSAPPAVPPAPVVAPSPAPLPVVVSAPTIPPAPMPAPTSAPAPALTPAPGPAPAPVAAPAVRTVRLTDLGAEQRRELPPLSLGGSVWSESALSRFVIVNGQVVREGDTAAPGVVVDRIGPKAVWLRWRDLRLEIAI